MYEPDLYKIAALCFILLCWRNGPYSQKRNNFSPGISLTSQTWFALLLFCKLVLPAKNAEYCEKKYYLNVFEDIYFTIVSLEFNEKRRKKINNLLSDLLLE